MAKIVEGLKSSIAAIKSGSATIIAEPMSSSQIKSFRESKGLSQERFAKALDVSVDTVRSWEQDKRRPSKKASEKIREIA